MPLKAKVKAKDWNLKDEAKDIINEEAELAWGLHTEINVRHRELNPDTVAHLCTNRARRID